MSRDLYRIAQEITDEVLGAGAYARSNAGHPDPEVQRAALASTDNDSPRSGDWGCPECGKRVDAHTGAGGPGCSLTDNGAAQRAYNKRKREQA